MAQIISILVPCYNEEETIHLLYKELCSVSDAMGGQYGVGFEFLLIDDGSSDRTLPILRELAGEDERVHYVSFSRNFGKEAAIFAGLKSCIGDYIVMLDADLQHPPSMLPQMYEGIINEGYDCVAAQRITRSKEPAIRSFFSRSFYQLSNRMSKTKMVDGATDFFMMTHQVLEAILEMPEYNRFFKGIHSWVGFNTKWLPYENVERVAGTTKWSFKGLLLYSMEGILSFSTVPLTGIFAFGIFLCLIAFVLFCVNVLKLIIYGDPIASFSTLLYAICFFSGIQLMFMGVLGQYIAKMHMEVKRRPIYIAKESKVGEKR